MASTKGSQPLKAVMYYDAIKRWLIREFKHTVKKMNVQHLDTTIESTTDGSFTQVSSKLGWGWVRCKMQWKLSVGTHVSEWHL